MVYFCDEGAGEEKGAEESEEDGPGVVGVGERGEGCGEGSERGEGGAGVGAVD